MSHKAPVRKSRADRGLPAGRAKTAQSNQRRSRDAFKSDTRRPPRAGEEAGKADGNAARLIDAAIRRLSRGRPISVSHVALEAGLSRATAYRVFSRQRDILEAVIQRRLEHIGISIARYVESLATFEDALILGIVESVRHVAADYVFVRAVTEAEYRGLTHLLIDSQARVMPIFEQVWGPWLIRARRSGQYPALPTDQEIFAFVRSMQVILLTSGQDPEAASRFIHRIVGPFVRSLREA